MDCDRDATNSSPIVAAPCEISKDYLLSILSLERAPIHRTRNPAVTYRLSTRNAKPAQALRVVACAWLMVSMQVCGHRESDDRMHPGESGA